jgi:hypothetical protein
VAGCTEMEDPFGLFAELSIAPIWPPDAAGPERDQDSRIGLAAPLLRQAMQNSSRASWRRRPGVGFPTQETRSCGGTGNHAVDGFPAPPRRRRPVRRPATPGPRSRSKPKPAELRSHAPRRGPRLRRPALGSGRIRKRVHRRHGKVPHESLRRHCDSPARTGARTKAVAPSPCRARSDLGGSGRRPVRGIC